MKHLLLILFLTSTLVNANETTRRDYLALIKDHPHLVSPLGNAAKGEIEIIIDPVRMAAIEKKVGREVGVIARDNYWIWINDACLFPSGQEGVYGRIIWSKILDYHAGVAVLAILPDKTIVLNCNYRHATRSWEIELPRGCVDPNESPEEAAKREVLEETGMVLDKLILLGKMPPDTGIAAFIAPVYAAYVKAKTSTHHEDTEAIEEIFSLSLEEIKKAFVRGYYECTIRGEKVKVAFRDPFLSYAINIYENTLINSAHHH